MRAAALACAVATCALVRAASAFHAGAEFDKPASSGGGGGIFYVGSNAERRWDCTACHVAPAHSIKLRVDSPGSTLFGGRRYTPGATYAIVVELLGEHAGLSSPRANYNGLSARFEDTRAMPAGALSGFSSEDFYDAGGATIASSGTQPNRTSWSFSWTAPSSDVGPVSFEVCVVDGNGGGGGANVTTTDPFEDDVACGAITLSPVVSPAAQKRTRR